MFETSEEVDIITKECYNNSINAIPSILDVSIENSKTIQSIANAGRILHDEW